MFQKIQCVLYTMAVMTGILLLYTGQTSASQIVGGDELMKVERISAPDAYDQVKSGKALLVCAYEKEEACRDMMLDGAITLKAIEEKLPEL